ncbi:hypothetical protein D4764_14G0004880, partial [Takifugu flavidus]
LYISLNNCDEDLNVCFKVLVDDFDYVLFASSAQMKCFGCGEAGHLEFFWIGLRQLVEAAGPALADNRTLSSMLEIRSLRLVERSLEFWKRRLSVRDRGASSCEQSDPKAARSGRRSVCASGANRAAEDWPAASKQNPEESSTNSGSETWTSSTPSAGSSRVHGSLPNQSTCVLCFRPYPSGGPVGGSPRVCVGPTDTGVRSLYDRRQSLVRIAGNDVVLLASSACDLQRSLDRFATACEAAGMKISTSKSEAMVLNRKKLECLLRVKEVVLPQVEEFKYLGVLFTSEGRMAQEIDRQIGAASAVMRTLHRSVVVKRELSRKAKLSIYQSIFAPTLTYGHELWVMTERTRSWVQAAGMSFSLRALP